MTGYFARRALSRLRGFGRDDAADSGVAEQHRRVRTTAPEHHELHPQLHHVNAGPEHAFEVEELRLAVQTVVVMYRDLDHTEPRVLNLAHHLEADDAGVLFQPHAIEDLSSHQSEVAVHVAHAQPEEQLDRVVIDAADHDAVPWIRSTDLV